MKKNMIMLIVLMVLFFLLSGCPLEVDTIEARIDNFVDGLNDSDRSELYTNFHPDTASYNQMKAPEFFDTTPLASEYAPFDLTLTSSPDNDAEGQQTVNADFSREGSFYDTCELVMEKDGTSWYIRRFTLDSFQILKPGVIE